MYTQPPLSRSAVSFTLGYKTCQNGNPPSEIRLFSRKELTALEEEKRHVVVHRDDDDARESGETCQRRVYHGDETVFTERTDGCGEKDRRYSRVRDDDETEVGVSASKQIDLKNFIC